jgi:putative IMPACT (imprinted ancient) family translation regulator
LEIQDTYKTIAQPSEEILYKEKNSKFFGYAFPITSEESKTHIEALKNNIPMQGTFVMPIK